MRKIRIDLLAATAVSLIVPLGGSDASPRILTTPPPPAAINDYAPRNTTRTQPPAAIPTPTPRAEEPRFEAPPVPAPAPVVQQPQYTPPPVAQTPPPVAPTPMAQAPAPVRLHRGLPSRSIGTEIKSAIDRLFAASDTQITDRLRAMATGKQFEKAIARQPERIAAENFYKIAQLRAAVDQGWPPHRSRQDRDRAAQERQHRCARQRRLSGAGIRHLHRRRCAGRRRPAPDQFRARLRAPPLGRPHRADPGVGGSRLRQSRHRAGRRAAPDRGGRHRRHDRKLQSAACRLQGAEGKACRRARQCQRRRVRPRPHSGRPGHPGRQEGPARAAAARQARHQGRQARRHHL